jgi:hypothetical protein
MLRKERLNSIPMGEFALKVVYNLPKGRREAEPPRN